MNQRLRLLAGLATTVALSGCVTPTHTAPPDVGAVPPAGTITVSVGPCFGFCPVYEASIAPGGTVRFTGRRHTAVLRSRSIRADTMPFRRLERDLAPFRPAAGTDVEVECTAAVSDTSSYTVVWTEASGTRTSATVQAGCPGGAGHTLGEILRDVPTRLGIVEWSRQMMRPGASRG